MTSCYIESHPENAPCTCPDCRWQGPASACDIVADIQERIAAGETVPAGECPKCGALCQLDSAIACEQAESKMLEALRLVDSEFGKAAADGATAKPTIRALNDMWLAVRAAIAAHDEARNARGF